MPHVQLSIPAEEEEEDVLFLSCIVQLVTEVLPPLSKWHDTQHLLFINQLWMYWSLYSCSVFLRITEMRVNASSVDRRQKRRFLSVARGSSRLEASLCSCSTVCPMSKLKTWALTPVLPSRGFSLRYCRHVWGSFFKQDWACPPSHMKPICVCGTKRPLWGICQALMLPPCLTGYTNQAEDCFLKMKLRIFRGCTEKHFCSPNLKDFWERGALRQRKMKTRFGKQRV